MLLSEKNTEGWPEGVVEDVTQQVHQLKNESFVMGGKIQGKPLLPLPKHLDIQDGSSSVLDWWVLLVPAKPGRGLSASEGDRSCSTGWIPEHPWAQHPQQQSLGMLRPGCPAGRPHGDVGMVQSWSQCGRVTPSPFSLAGYMDVSVLHATETIVIEWSQQIRDILSKDSAESLLEGLHPLPRAEFDFWHTRTVNLQCINDQVLPREAVATSPVLSPGAEPLTSPCQLLSPQVTALAEMLEKANSCFWLMLQSVFQDVSAGKCPDHGGQLPLPLHRGFPIPSAGFLSWARPGGSQGHQFPPATTLHPAGRDGASGLL